MLKNINDPPENHLIHIDLSEHQRIVAELQQEQLFSRSILDALPGIFYLYSYPECRLILWNHQHEKLLGFPPGEMLGRHVTDWFSPEFKSTVMSAINEVMASGQGSIEAPLIDKNGLLVYFALTGIRFEAKNQSFFLGIGTDITEHRKLENDQREALNRLQKIASRVPGVVYQFRLRPDGSSCFPFASKALHEIYRLSPEEVLDDATQMYAVLHPDDLEDVKASVQKSAQDLTMWRQDYRVKFEDGTERWLSGNAMPERETDGGILWHGFITDITEKKAMEEQVRQMAFIDVLTNLPNRRLLSDRLTQAMVSSTRSGCYGALMFLDLDNFKPLNDAYGHAVGDRLLIEVANRLKRCVRGVDTVARFGGDEFVVMISKLEGNRAESIAKAYLIADKIRVALSEPYFLGNLHNDRQMTTIEHRCTVSIGLNLFIGNDASQDDVLLSADKAMYQAKEAGRNSIQIAPEPPRRVGMPTTAPTNFVQLAWHSDYECGHALIDNQHRALFGDANRLITAILSESQSDEISALIEQLVHDVVQHFKDEERIFTAAGFAGATEHSAIHRQLVDRASVLVGRFHAGTLAVGELFQFLAYDVVSKHMLKVDREFFPILKP